MKYIWHYIKNNDYPKNDLDKLILIKNDLSDEGPYKGFSFKIGYWREDINAFDSENGFLENVVAWSELPLISLDNI